MTPSLGSVSLLERHTELREAITFTSLLKDTVEDTNGQVGEVIRRERSGKVLRAGASVPVELGCVILPGRHLPNLETL